MAADVRIGKWLTIPIASVVVLLAVVAWASVSAMAREAALARNVVTVEGALAQTASDMRAHVLGLRRFEKDYFLNAADEKKTAEYLTRWSTEEEAAQRDLSRLRTLAYDPSDKTATAAMAESLAAYADGFRHVTTQMRSGEIRTAGEANLAMGRYKSAIHGLENEAIATAQKKAGVMRDQVTRIDHEANVGTAIVLGTTFLALLFGVAVSFLLARGIALPLREISTVMTSLAAGDLRAQPLQPHGKDEIGRLTLAVNAVADRFRNLLRQSSDTSVQLSSAAGELLATAKMQERGAHDQSEGISSMHTLLDGTRAALKLIDESAGNVLANAELSQTNSGRVEQQIAELAKRTQRIADLSDAIRDIATKSELLALNASLEGTRAGEAGKGFSLVATQMQRLSDSVLAQVRDIKEISGAIGEATRAAVAGTDESTKLSRATTSAAQSIAAAIREQTIEIEETARWMSKVSTIATESASGGREVVVAVAQLQERAETLSSIVSSYRLS